MPAAGAVVSRAGPGLSIVVPAFNEAPRLPRTLPRLMEYVAALGEPGEIVLVDDGSADRTGEVAAAIAAGRDHVRVLQSPGNRGKGASVRRGVLAARYDHVLFTDADLSTPIADAAKLRAALVQGADVAIGSRRLAGSAIGVRQPWPRHLAGRAFSGLVALLFLPGIQDSQCGFKAFRRPAATELFGRQRLDRFAFDVEVLWLARRLGYRIAEVPVSWSDDAGSHIRLARDASAMLADLARIQLGAVTGRYRLRRGRSRPARPGAGP